jgi:hypothetical protein
MPSTGLSREFVERFSLKISKPDLRPPPAPVAFGQHRPEMMAATEAKIGLAQLHVLCQGRAVGCLPAAGRDLFAKLGYPLRNLVFLGVFIRPWIDAAAELALAIGPTRPSQAPEEQDRARAGGRV